MPTYLPPPAFCRRAFLHATTTCSCIFTPQFTLFMVLHTPPPHLRDALPDFLIFHLHLSPFMCLPTFLRTAWTYITQCRTVPTCLFCVRFYATPFHLHLPTLPGLPAFYIPALLPVLSTYQVCTFYTILFILHSPCIPAFACVSFHTHTTYHHGSDYKFHRCLLDASLPPTTFCSGCVLPPAVWTVRYTHWFLHLLCLPDACHCCCVRNAVSCRFPVSVSSNVNHLKFRFLSRTPALPALPFWDHCCPTAAALPHCARTTYRYACHTCVRCHCTRSVFTRTPFTRLRDIHYACLRTAATVRYLVRFWFHYLPAFCCRTYARSPAACGSAGFRWDRRILPDHRYCTHTTARCLPAPIPALGIASFCRFATSPCACRRVLVEPVLRTAWRTHTHFPTHALCLVHTPFPHWVPAFISSLYPPVYACHLLHSAVTYIPYYFVHSLLPHIPY